MPPTASVTVVIPTYRRPELVKGAIESVLAQTFGDFQVIVSDDQPSAEVELIVRAFGDSRVTYRPNSPGLGQALNPLLPMSQAETPFVACLHDDDLWEPSLLSVLVPRLVEDPEVVVAFSDHSLMDADGLPQPEASAEVSRRWGRAALSAGRHKPFHEIAVVRQTLPAMMTAVIRRDAVRWELPREVGRASDLWLGYLLARTGSAAYYEPMRLGRYRSHAASSTLGGGIERVHNALFCYDQMLGDPACAAVWPQIRARRNTRVVDLGLHNLREQRWRAGRRILAGSLRIGFSRRAALGVLVSLAPRPLARGLLGIDSQRGYETATTSRTN
jgi:glycosyltransferase involved in cell wall biosynthesis